MKHPEQMTMNSYLTGKIKRKFEQFFDKRMLDRLGKISGFVQRSPKKITPLRMTEGTVQLAKEAFSHVQPLKVWGTAL